MPKIIQDDAVDDLIFQRWTQARDLCRAFRRASLNMRRRFKRVGSQLETALKADGYRIYAEREWAEYKTYRPEWCLEEDDPLVVMAVGALYPVGYFRVQEPSAYVCLYNEGIDWNMPEDGLRLRDLLYEELGGKPTEWQDRTVDDNWGAPLWAEIPNSDDADRIQLARSMRELRAFAVEHFQKLFAIAEPVGRAVKRFRDGTSGNA